MTQPTGILITFHPAETDGANPALVNRVAREVVDSLRQQQQTIEPTYTTLRSGDVYQWLVTAAGTAKPCCHWSHSQRRSCNCSTN